LQHISTGSYVNSNSYDHSGASIGITRSSLEIRRQTAHAFLLIRWEHLLGREASDFCLCKQFSYGLLRPDGCVKWAGRRREPMCSSLWEIFSLLSSWTNRQDKISSKECGILNGTLVCVLYS